MSHLAAENGTLQPNLTLILVAGVLIACGVYLLLERALTRILLGIILAGNGVALLYLATTGHALGAPLLSERSPEEMTDPLPMAMVLTAIVITLATVSFVLALAYRQWQLTGSDDIPDDLEDALIQRLASRDETSSTYEESDESTTEAEEDAAPQDAAEMGLTTPEPGEAADLDADRITQGAHEDSGAAETGGEEPEADGEEPEAGDAAASGDGPDDAAEPAAPTDDDAGPDREDRR